MWHHHLNPEVRTFGAQDTRRTYVFHCVLVLKCLRQACKMSYKTLKVLSTVLGCPLALNHICFIQNFGTIIRVHDPQVRIQTPDQRLAQSPNPIMEGMSKPSRPGHESLRRTSDAHPADTAPA